MVVRQSASFTHAMKQLKFDVHADAGAPNSKGDTLKEGVQMTMLLTTLSAHNPLKCRRRINADGAPLASDISGFRRATEREL